MALCLVRTQIVPQIQILQVQILVQILTPALILTKTQHQMVVPVFIALHVIWGQLQGGGSPFSNPPPPLSNTMASCQTPPPHP